MINRDLDYPEVTLRDKELFWRLRPAQDIASDFFDGDTIRINSLGLRGREVGDKNNRKRIIALGNSCTFGWGVSEDSVYSNQLRHILGQGYDVINAGIPGYTSYQGKVFFEKEIAKLQPDILLILFAWNDHWPAAGEIQDKDQQFPPDFIIAIQNQLSRLHSYRLLRKWLLVIVEKERETKVNRVDPKFRVGFEDFSANLKEICDRARSAGATPILMTSPIPFVNRHDPLTKQSTLHRYHERYNNIIRQLANQEGIEIVDLAIVFDKHDDLFDEPSYDPIHFNSKGHRITADKIAELINYLSK